MPSITIYLTKKDKRITTGEWGVICYEVFKRIKERTPVRTGRCKSNWDMTDHSEGRGTSYRIFNPTPYVSFLENGHSRQAPEGMVRPTLQELPEIIALVTHGYKKYKQTVRIPEYIPVDLR